MRHIAASGGAVLTERIDYFRIDGRHISVPCMGIFEVREGKIMAWRDCWDLQQVERQLRPGPE